MWVKEILPPRLRLSWLLMTIRLSISSLAGMARTLVAVGTSSDADMFLTTAAAAPRSTCNSSPAPGGGVAALTGGAVAAPLPVPAGPAVSAGLAGAEVSADGWVVAAGFGCGAVARACPSAGLAGSGVD